MLTEHALDHRSQAIFDKSVGRNREMPKTTAREARGDFRQIVAQEGLAAAETDPQQRSHAFRRRGEPLEVFERRPRHAGFDFAPVETMPAARIATPCDKHRQMQRRTTTDEAAGREAQVSRSVQDRRSRLGLDS